MRTAKCRDVDIYVHDGVPRANVLRLHHHVLTQFSVRRRWQRSHTRHRRNIPQSVFMIRTFTLCMCCVRKYKHLHILFTNTFKHTQMRASKHIFYMPVFVHTTTLLKYKTHIICIQICITTVINVLTFCVFFLYVIFLQF